MLIIAEKINATNKRVSGAIVNKDAAFIQELAEQLHQNGKRLTIHVEAPVQVAEDRWETGAYNWRTLGDATDAIKFPGLQDPFERALEDRGRGPLERPAPRRELCRSREQRNPLVPPRVPRLTPEPTR